MLSCNRKLSPRQTPLLILLLLTSLNWASQAQAPAHGTSTAPAYSIYTPPEEMFGEMPLVAPVFIQTDQIDSSITVVNAIVSSVKGDVTLRDQSGSVIGSQIVSFPSHSSTSLAMKSLLSSFGSQAHSGSVTIIQDKTVKGPALLAQLSMTMHKGSQPAFLEEEFGMPTAHGSSVLRGIASRTSNSPILAITSVSDVAQSIQASCIGENKTSTTLELPPGGTLVVKACFWQSVPDGELNMSSSLLSGDISAEEADHAISLKSDSVPGSFFAFGFAPNGNLAQVQLQPVDFYDPGLLPSSKTVYVGVPVGSTTLLPSTLSAPVLTLANFTSQQHSVNVLWSDSSLGKSQVKQVANLTLAPLSTRTTTLSQVTGSGFLNTFTITANGAPGEVQAHLFTQVESSKQRMELLSKDAKDPHNGGDHPWSIANGDRSTLLLYNSSDQTHSFHVRISGSGNTWIKPYDLSAFETLAISINDIVTKHVTDHQKSSLPPSLTSGEVQWTTEFGGTGLGRLLVTNDATSLARNFSCATYYNLCWASFGPENFQNLFFDGALVDLSTISPTFCTEYSPTSCAQNSPVGNSSAYSFSTYWQSSSGVSQVSSSKVDLKVKGVTVGPYSVTALVQAGSCQSPPLSGGGNVKPIPIPTNFRVQTVSADASGNLNWLYYWDSSTSGAITSDLTQCTVRENVSYPGSGGFNWTSPPYDTSGNPTDNPTLGTSPAINGAIGDHQLHPGFRKPYTANNFTATQVFQFSCTNYQSGAWIALSPPYPIVRTVSGSGTSWKYNVTKGGKVASVSLP